jgi:hypothetical protein
VTLAPGVQPWAVVARSRGATLYGGMYEEGIHKSTDSGYTWLAANSGLANLLVLSLTIDSLDALRRHGGRRRGLQVH